MCSRLRHVLSSMSAPLLLELHIGCDFLMAPQCMHEAYMLLRAAEQLPGVSISLWLGGHAVLWEHQLPAEPEHSTCGAGAVDTDMSDTEAGSTNTGSTDTGSAHTTTSSAQCSGLRSDLHCAVSSLAAILQAAGSSLVAINVDVPSTWWHVLNHLRHCGATAECIQALQVQLPSLTWLSSDCLKCRTCSGMQSVHSYYCKVEGGALDHPCHELDLYSAHAPDLVQLMTAHATAAHVGSIES